MKGEKIENWFLAGEKNSGEKWKLFLENWLNFVHKGGTLKKGGGTI